MTPRIVQRLAGLALGVVVGAAGATGAALAQGNAAGRADPGADALPVHAARLQPGEHIRLTGALDHPAWQRAPLHTHFVQRFPKADVAPVRATRVRVLFDADALYVGVEADDPDPAQIRAPLVRHDQVSRAHDFVAVYLDAIGQRRSAQFFRVNAAGSTADGMHTAADDSEDFAPDFDFDAAARPRAGGYSVVLRIPFASLRFARERHGDWRMMVVRRSPQAQSTLDTSVRLPRDAPSFIAALQPLRGVELPAAPQFLTLRPSVTAHAERGRDAGGVTTSARGVQASLDLKWRPLPEWVLDATLNPDFSQVALDVPQLQGNRLFALSLPEKRPFFFESSDLLRSPSEALYTRSFTEPRWGLRSTWRGRHWAGSAFAIDDRGGGAVLLPGAYGTGLAAQPASTIVAARALQQDGTLQWGALAVDRRYRDGRGENQVAGPDLAWQIDDAWRLRAQWLHARTTAQPDAAGALAREAARDGHQAVLRVARQTDRSDTTLTLADISADFRHDSGFVAQSGVRTASLYAGRGWGASAPLNEVWLNLHADAAIDARSGRRVSSDVYPTVWLAGPRNMEWEWHWHGAAALRTQADAPLLRERYWKSELSITPTAWLPMVTASARYGRIADQVAQQVRRGGDFNATLSVRPHARLELEPSGSIAWLDRAGVRTYRESVAQVLAVWHFDAAHSLRAIVQRTSLQRLAEPGVAAQRDASTQGSLTYAWRQSAGTVLYAGLNRARLGAQAAERDNEAFVKIQLDVDQARRWIARSRPPALP